MTEKYYSILTNGGKELEAAASAGGAKIVLQDFVIGDGNGKAVIPDPTRTVLIREVYRAAISSLDISREQKNQFIAHLVIPASVGGFTVREVGLLTDAGELYATANCAAIEKPESGISVNLQFRLAVSETANIELKVATGEGLFLRQDASLKDVKDNAEARKNIGCGNAATMSYSTADYKQLVGAETEAASTRQLVGLRNDTVKKTGDDIAWLNVKGDLNTDGTVKISSQLQARGNGVNVGGEVRSPANIFFPYSGDGMRAEIYGVDVVNDHFELRMVIAKDGNGIKYFTFKENGDFHANGNIVAGGELQANNGAVRVAQDGNINGPMWGGWLRDWLDGQLTARDNNINTRATWDYVNQTFVRDVQLGAVVSGEWGAAGGDCPAGHVLTGGDFNDNYSFVRYKPIQRNINGVWANVAG